MADLAQAFSEIKSLPDHILQKEISSPSGSIPGWLALGEIHERKRIRATTGSNQNKRPSMAEEYAGNIQNIYAGAGLSQPATPQAMPPPGVLPPQSQPGGGIAGLPPPAPSGLASMPQAQAPQGYHNGGVVGLARGGPVFYMNQDAIRNQQLTEQLYGYLGDAVSNVYGPGYRLGVYSGGQSGERRTGSVRHNEGRAADVYVIDPEGNRLSGDALAPLGQYWAAKKYGGVGMEMHGGGIHLDEWATPPAGGGMSWNYADQGGQYTTAQQAAIEAGLRGELPLMYTGGGGQVVSALSPQARALLDTIAGPESAGKYNVIYGGQTFDDYTRHPGVAIPIRTGPNAGDTSSAAGRYQFLGSTWDDISQRYNLADFSPQNQDLGAYYLAKEQYKAATGGDLDAVLQSGDPTALASVGQALNKTWTSLPGGIEQGIGTDRFVSAYQTALNNPTAAAAAGTAQASNAVATQAADTAGKMASAEGAAEGDPMSQYFLMQQLFAQQQQPAAPAPAPVAQPVARPVDARQFMQNPFFMQRRAYGLA
jgi:muramidase (phage lysozyme)